MSRRIAGLALVISCLGLGSVGLRGQSPANASPAPCSADAPTAAIVTPNRVLHERLVRIAAGSTLWRHAVKAVGQERGCVVVLTSADVVVVDPARGRLKPFDPTAIAEAAPLPSDDGKISVVMVVVNLRLLEEVHDRQRTLPAEFDADLDRILIHEVYGHALPYLAAGNLSGRCADPRPGERPSDACAIRRENAVRAELGLGRRADYGLQSLWLARGTWR